MGPQLSYGPEKTCSASTGTNNALRLGRESVAIACAKRTRPVSAVNQDGAATAMDASHLGLPAGAADTQGRDNRVGQAGRWLVSEQPQRFGVSTSRRHGVALCPSE